MPITTGLTSRTLALKGKGHIHTERWHRCIEHVKAKGGGYEPHAVCTHSIGYKESINPEHRTPGPHASANTRRFKESAKRRREAQKVESYAAILKFDVHRVLKEHKCWGRVCGALGLKKKSKSQATPASGLSSVPKILDALEISPEKMAEHKKQAEHFRKERLAREAKLTPEQRKRLERQQSE